ncbi:TetR family transcriptional regulator [Paenibacillus sp. 5J-6]|uniref:TetR family transcriptional regulator n=1 Tax=Paenibacillus silvestris TaxID=2606219 RepID=A0A6L8V6P6_9BACL|nr:TetR/AcrR family transcriptional regulator [Paenibacillus silvestris]MZQ85281.1 TetR family transcriptional regulator [Paenibacillus silvestris]
MSRPREFDYEQVLHAATDVFREHGYHASSYELLMKGTSLKKQSLYGAFGDKKSLFEKSISFYCSNFLTRFEKMMSLNSSGLDALRCMQKNLLKTDPEELDVGCLIVNSTLEVTSPEFSFVKENFDNMFHGIKVILNQVILAGQEEGTITKKIPSEQLAFNMANSIIGIRVMIRANMPKDQIQAVLDAAIETIVI